MKSLRHLAVVTLSIAIPATGVRAATLADASPFLPYGANGAQAGAANGGLLELRGVMSGSFGYLFYVYDPLKKRGVWAGANDAEIPFTIVEGDANLGYLEIRTNDGRLLHLKLLDGKILPGGQAAAAASGSATNAVADQGSAHARLTESQSDWREEFNRRLAENAAEN